MRYLIEVRPNVFRDEWFPKENRATDSIQVWQQFADADRVFRDLYGRGNPTIRLVETDETDEQLKARRR